MMTDISLTGLAGERLPVEGSVIDALGAGMRGKLVLPQSAEYESARQIHNMIHDRRPGLIARVAGVADVIRVVQFAREYGLLTSIKGGGHGVAGFASNDGGLMIDLSAMQAVHVDPQRRIARAQGGATWGTFFHETQAFGLATTGGVNRPTGIAGLTLGGGHGFLMRSCGLSVDNLLSVDVVTADGQLLTASAQENPELFWGMRGAGHNFGVATSFEYRLHPVGPEVLAGVVAWPREQAGEALAFYSDYATNAAR